MLAEQSVIGMLIIERGRIIYANSVCENILGYPLSTIQHWNLRELFRIVHKDDLQEVIDSIFSLQNCSAGQQVINHQHRIITQNKEIKWVKVIAKTINYRHKTQLLSSIIDINDQMKARKEMIEFERSKSEIMARVSHELKTPLITIKGYALLLKELLDEHIDFTSLDLYHYLDLIQKGSDRLEDVINSILIPDEVFPESSHKVPKIHLDLLLVQCITEFISLGLIRNQSIRLDLPGNLYAECEPSHFRLVFFNLYSNAVKYTPPRRNITIKGRELEKKVMITVKDEGIGLTELEMRRIFTKLGKIERYGKGWDVKGEGLGMGLYNSRLIVESYGGTLWVESKGRNRGTTFYFTFPKRYQK